MNDSTQILPLGDWMRSNEKRAVADNGYHMHGLLVPLEEFEQCAERVLSCGE